MKRKSPTLVGARKRARVSDGSSSPSPESPSRCVAAVKETLSIREQAEPYRLATVKFPIDDLTPEWTDGTNRTINAAHKRRLTRAFGQFGLDRMAEGNRLRLASTKEEVSRMMEELRRAGEVGANEGRRSDRERPWASFWDWVRINGTQVELMAGNHRVEALKDYLKQFPDAAHERWWLCDIYDRGAGWRPHFALASPLTGVQIPSPWSCPSNSVPTVTISPSLTAMLRFGPSWSLCPPTTQGGSFEAPLDRWKSR